MEEMIRMLEEGPATEDDWGYTFAGIVDSTDSLSHFCWGHFNEGD